MQKRATLLRFVRSQCGSFGMLSRFFRECSYFLRRLVRIASSRENPQAAIKMVICSVVSPVLGVPGISCRCSSEFRLVTEVCAETSLAAVVVVVCLL